MHAVTDRIVFFCPLAIEAKAVTRGLRAAGFSSKQGAPLVQTTGPGPVAIEHTVRTAAQHVKHKRETYTFVLAGVAGGLTVPVGTCAWASEVVAANGVFISNALGELPVADQAQPAKACRIAGIDSPASTPAHKQEIAAHTAACMVDTESHVFARLCHELSMKQAVLRAVSDGPEDTLPAATTSWVDSDGKTKILAVLRSLALKQVRASELATLAKHSNTALVALEQEITRVMHKQGSKHA